MYAGSKGTINTCDDLLALLLQRAVFLLQFLQSLGIILKYREYNSKIRDKKAYEREQ